MTHTRTSRLWLLGAALALSSSVHAQEFITPLPLLSVNPAQGQLAAQMPLPALPGHGEFAPALSLVYQPMMQDAAQGFGVGWMLNTSSIQVSNEQGLPHPYYSLNVDKKTRDSWYQVNWDGQPLRYLGQADGVVSYTTESFDSKIQILRYDRPFAVALRNADGVLVEQTISSGFEVRLADGTRRIYSGDSAVAESYFYLTTGTLPEVQRKYTSRWPLVYEIKPGGDAIQYHYRVDQGRSYLQSVSFGAERSRYVLQWKARDLAPVSFSAGFRQESRLAYTRIVACVDDQPQFSWVFGYEGQTPDFTAASCRADGALALASEPSLLRSAWDSVVSFFADETPAAQGRSLRLNRIYRFGRTVGQPADATIAREPTMELRYQDWQKPAADAAIVQEFKNFGGMNGFGLNKNAELFDANQDGLPDLVVYDKASNSDLVYLNQMNGFAPGENLKIKRGTAAPFTPQLNEGTQTTRFLRADLNGDGWEDLIEIGGDTSWTVFLNRQAQGRIGYESIGIVLNFKLDKSYFADGRGAIIDINGDNRPDIIYPILGTDGKAQFQAYINTTPRGADGISFAARTYKFPFSTTSTSVLTQPEFRLIDANQDGLVDLVKIVALNTGAKGLCLFENQGLAGMSGALLFREDKPKAGVTCEDQYFLPIDGLEVDQPSLTETINSMVLMDVNSDGITDFVRINDKQHQLEYWLGLQGQKGFAKKETIPLDGDIKVSKSKYDTLTADLDQDGYEEILVWNADTKSLSVIRLNQTQGLGLLAGLRLENGLEQTASYRSYASLRSKNQKPLPQAATLVQQLRQHKDSWDTDLYRYGNAIWDNERANLLGFDQVQQFSPGTRLDGELREEARLIAMNFNSGLNTLEDRRYLLDYPKATETYSLPWTQDQETALAQGTLAFPDLASQVLQEVKEQAYSLKSFAAPAVTGDIPAHVRPRFFVKRDLEIHRFPSGRVNRTSSFYDDSFRLSRQVLNTAAIPAPRDLLLPEGELQTSWTYDPASEALGILTNVQERVIKSLKTGRTFTSYRAQYHPVWGLPTVEQSTTNVSDEARAQLPEALANLIPVESTRTQSTSYDGGDGTGFGLIESIADDLGLIESYTYGPGSLFRVATQNAKGQIAHSCHSDRDCTLSGQAVGPVRTQPVFTQTIQGYWTHKTFDDLQRPLQIQSALGEIQNFRYRAGSFERPFAVIAELGTLEQRLYLYDAEGQALIEALGQGDKPAWIQTQRTYSRQGVAIAEANPYATSTSLASLADSTYGSLPAAAVGSSFQFDSIGRLIASASPGQLESAQYSYPAWGRSETKTAAGISRTRQFIARDLTAPEALIDEEDQLHVYQRDEFGLLRSIQTVDDKAPRSFVYDTGGELLATILPGIQTRVLERDSRGRINSTHSLSFDGKEQRTLSHHFDELDRLLEVRQGDTTLATYYYDQLEDPEGALIKAPGSLLGTRRHDPLRFADTFDVFERDSKDRILRQKTLYLNAANEVLQRFEESRSYRADDQESEARFGDQLTVRYGYNPGGLLQEVEAQFTGQAPQKLLSDAQWSPGQLLAQSSFADRGFQGTWDNDSVQLLTRGRTLSGLRETYTHDAQGLLRQSPAGTFHYNKRGELTAADGTIKESWQLSGAGHFLAQNQDTLQSSPRSALLPRAPSASALSLDNLGRVSALAGTEALYDSEDRLLQTKNAQGTSTYGYHANGQRSYKRSVAADGSNQVSYYPGDLLIAEADQRVTLPLPGQLSAELNLSDKTVSYLALDAVNTPTARLDAKGQLLESWTRGAYGQLISHSGTSSANRSPASFGGHREDSETAWIDMGFRTYIPALGRFATPDPFFLDDPERCLDDNWQECELYTYVANNPISLEDPTGLMLGRASSSATTRVTRALSALSRHSPAVSVSVRGASGSVHVSVTASLGHPTPPPAAAVAAGKVIVIGEGMGRIKGAARDLKAQGINAKWYQAWGKNFKTGKFDLGKSLDRNERWMLQKIKEGYHIYDVGHDPGRSSRSPFYALERSIIAAHNYPTTPLSRSGP